MTHRNRIPVTLQMKALLVFLCTIIAAVHGEFAKDPTLCGRTKCRVPADRKFKYLEGTYYHYQYSVDVSTNLGGHITPGYPTNESTLHIDGVATLHFTTPCEGHLRFSNVSISHDRTRYNAEFPDRAGAEFKGSLERYSLRFAFDDGQIHEVCPNRKETVWALNLKKGVLSMLQNTMKRFDVDHRVEELDVNGVCDTKYNLYEARKTSLIVRKTKNLAECTLGRKHLSIVQSTAYRSPRSKALSQPLLRSTSECEITIDHNVYESVVCKDLHRLQPFSHGNEAGARTESTATLKLVEESRTGHGSEYDDDDDDEMDDDNEEESKYVRKIGTKRTTLLYDHAKTSKTMHGELRTARDLLKNMCKLSANSDELQQRFSEMFTAFVHSARLLDFPSLSQLFARANGICRNGKKHIVKALPFIGTNPAVNVMKNLIMRKFVDKTTTDHWVTTFALIPRPDQDTVRVLAPLLDFQHEIPDAQFILSYSAVIHAYCDNHRDECARLNAVRQFLSYLEENVQGGCTPRTHSLATTKETIQALKAIGNMGLETEPILEKLKTCIEDTGGFLPMEIRVAAIDAHRRLPSCEKTRDEFFLNYYRNFTLDSEIRIASYLQVMRCPDYNVIKTIKHTLKNEEVNQVGSFVWSHLTNLYASSSPTRVEIQSLLTDRDLGTKFNSDMRKFSRNYDGSFFSEEYNFGANYQSNLIFSPKSYIPRTVSFNMTMDVLGESVNVFEIAARMEGLEYYAESLFGPDGPYSGEKVSNHVHNFLRSFRSANENDDYWKDVNRLPNVIDNNFDHPRVSLSYKVFGNELKYVMLDGDQEIKTTLASLNPIEMIKQILLGQEVHYENTVMFMDSTYVIPTSSGLPVRLDMSGSAAYNFKLSGLLDSKNLYSGEFEFMGNIMPSASIDVVGSMTVDAFYKSSGIKLRTNVYSSGAAQVELIVKGARQIRLSLGLPNKKMEVFSIATDVLLTSSNGAEIDEKAIGILIAGQNYKNPKNLLPRGTVISNTTCSWAALDRLIGLKMCADYQFPNVTKNPNASYFVLNGPTFFKATLNKADPTAKNYVLEYSWVRTENSSVIRTAFDTPGSQVNRELSATVVFETKSNNVTVTLKSSGNSLIAKGIYKRTDDETFIDVGFDVNGTKHLDLTLGYSREKFTYGYTYIPKMQLTIYNERVAKLSGSIRNAHKMNMTQCDIDLTFQTKKVWSRLVGYIVKRNTSLAGDFQLDYQLQRMPKKETLHLEISLANRSSRPITHKAAELKLHSTAYSQLNTVITAWYQQALGHLEVHAEVNSSPHLKDDRHKLTAQLIISYSKVHFQNQGTKVNVLFAITKPIQNLDIKIGINHYSVGTESKTSLLIGYAPGKEISLVVNLITPRGLLFSVEGHANLTIPNFNSMLLDVRINERSRREYELDFAGTWFSGHNITARGTYTDRSTPAVVSHNLKLILKSPSFINDVLVNCKLYHDYNNLEVSIHVDEIDVDKYAFILNYTSLSATRLITYVEGRYKSNVYSVLTSVDTDREIRIEMHLDKWRDVHLTFIGTNNPKKKEFGVELKWDANRDPALKFVTIFTFEKQELLALAADNRPAEKNLTALLVLSYPGRLVTGRCLLGKRGDFNYLLNSSLEWNPEKVIRLAVEGDYNVQTWITSMKLEAQLLTPFELWRKTALNAKYVQEQNAIAATVSANWRDSQNVLVAFYGKEEEHDDLTEWSADLGMRGTVHSIEWVTATLTHKVLKSRSADTQLVIKYHPDKVIDARSIWQLDKESDDVFNLTGSIHLESPLASYRKSDMKCQLRVMPNWKFAGAANLELDKRKYTSTLIGDLWKFKESMVEFNVTTPLEKYAFVRGRFGLSESDRHIVAEIVTPTGPLGIEAYFQLFTALYDFNVKLQIATPIEAFQKALLVAKLGKREADFRIANNNITAGFQGVWHYNNLTDFDYTYILYTPLHGLHECGIITKLIVTRTEPDQHLDVDSEFSIRMVETKVGIKMKGGPKPPPVRIPIKKDMLIVSGNKSKEENGSGEGDEEEEEEDEEDCFYWRGELEVYLAVIEAMTAEFDLDNEGPSYKIVYAMQIPHGKILLNDNFWMEDVFNMKNDLSIETPFDFANEVTSLYVLSVDLEKHINMMRMDFNVRRNLTWYESGLSTNYTFHKSELDDSKTHIVKINVKTPLEFLKYIDTRLIVDIDENFYKSNLAVRAENCTVDLIGSLELEDAFFDTIFSVKVNSSALFIPRTKITAKKDFSDKEKQLKLGITIEEPVPKSTTFQATWQIQNHTYIKTSLGLDTWIPPLKNIETNFLFVDSIANNGTARLNANFKHNVGQEFKVSGVLQNGTIDAELYTPIATKEHFEFHGNLLKLNGSLYRVQGDWRNKKTSETYGMVTDITTQNEAVSTLETVIRPKIGGALADNIVIRVKKERYGVSVATESQNINASLNVNYINTLNWDVRAHADTVRQEDLARDQYDLSTFMNVQVNGNTTLYIHAETPWKNIEALTIEGNMLLTNNSGKVGVNHKINHDYYHMIFQWKLIYFVDMFANIIGGYEIADIGKKDVNTLVFFKNPGKAFRSINTGFDIDIDHEEWNFATNVTVGFRNVANFDAVLTVKLPPPNNDKHRVLVSYHAPQKIQEMSYVVGYNALNAKTNYASDGSLHMLTNDINGHLRATWGMLPTQSINNLFNITFDKKEVDLMYSVFTPKFLQEETLILLFNYNGVAETRSLLKADVFYPARKKVGTANISFVNLANVNGTVNASTTLPNFSYAGCNFVVATTLKQNKRFIEIFWPNNTALLDSEYTYHSEKLDSNLEGTCRLEVPLNTRHVGYLTYGYKKRPQVTTGYSVLDYNGQKILHGQYNSKSESRAGFEKDRIEITIENVYAPVGIIYINQYEYSAGNEGTNYPTVEFKQANIYRLDNSSLFNIIGESRIRTTHTGQEIHLKAIHSNRTVQLKTDYEVLPGEFDQNAWLSLAEDAWISYHINILNKTTEEVENQFIVISVAYPRRNFTLDGSYKINSNELNSEAKLEWDQDKEVPRTLGAAFDWRNITSDQSIFQQQASLSFRHPSFVKEVTLKGEILRRDVHDLINLAAMVDYSVDPDKLLVLSALLRDESELPHHRRYTYNISGRHPKTRFNLDIGGFVHKYDKILVETQNRGKYKRSFLPEESGQFNARIDSKKREILFHRESNEVVKYFKIDYYPEHPVYVVNGSLINTPNLNSTGEFYFNPDDKLTWMMVNYTPDAIESLRMYGKIPDARNAAFDIWRTYDQDLTVSDVSFYVKLNHSRLVTSTLRWRPDLKSDVIDTIKNTVSEMYENIHKDADYWKQYVKSETISVITEVWEDAQDEISEFLHDWNDLKNLEQDFKDLKIYLNNSYNANDFYIRDIVACGIYIIDELSLRSHIESLPNILNEVWEIMGESGEAIRQSLLWIIETIKKSYDKISEIITAVLRGDSISQVANIIERLIEKYDMFIKDLHVSFIKYIENLWNQISTSISQQWYKFLKIVEPLFIRMLHYLETVLWKASKEIVDFLYDRRNEIMTSPYFDRFTNFTQDIDRFYRDIKGNDIITNVQKYSGLVIKFLKERYFAFVPFGKELKDVVDEIVSELKELRKLPSVHYALDKMQQVYDKANYLVEYFDVKAKIESLVRLIHSKLVDISQSALQAESRYREAKTKFIFDPYEGLMCLEQKLPMSWHAFNQTPEFQEIPEYRAIADLKSYFAVSNTTFWTLYYQYKPYTEPSNWLPPFKAQAMIIGPQYFTTFDGRYFDFAGSCTHLLAHDFVRNTFTILVKYDQQSDKISHQIIILIGDKAIELDIFKDMIRLVSKSTPNTATNLQLPVELDNATYVYQEENVVTVERKDKQFRLECNLKFDLCILELAGWYYGKTAGLLGTMNNEPMDDTMSSEGIVLKDVGEFAQSWTINNDDNCPRSGNLAKTVKQVENSTVVQFCEELFLNKSSEFSSCFGVIDPNEYARMCLNSENEAEVCSVTMSYMQTCMFYDTYLRIPDKCTTCTMIDGTQVAEGEFKKLEGDSVPKSVDVVFIVEAKECNRDIKQNRSIEQLVTQLNKEFRDQGLVGNRWSLVAFGGDGVFNQPRSVILDGQIFTKNVARFVEYFDHVPVGDGSQDIFAAIGFASQLVFRAGVSKTFVLMPCSHCEPENQTLDYYVMYQVLREHDIPLHILMDGEFQFEKERLNKIFYGLDATKSYTKKDTRTLSGDMDLRRQVKLSKTILGYCTALSLETNGTIFSGSKLRFEKLPSIKKFVSVFSKRVALTAQPSSCQHCECTADNDGTTQMECMPCVYPTPVTIDYESFNFNESLSALQPLDLDYGQLDLEDD